RLPNYPITQLPNYPITRLPDYQILIGDFFKPAQYAQRLLVVVRQHLHQDGGGDPLLRIDPEVRVVDAAPADASRAAHRRIGRLGVGGVAHAERIENSSFEKCVERLTRYLLDNLSEHRRVLTVRELRSRFVEERQFDDWLAASVELRQTLVRERVPNPRRVRQQIAHR